MRFKIPANTNIDDKILPFLSMKQLIILSIWAAISYAVFNILYAMWYLAALWGTLDTIIMWLTFSAAFLKINHLEFHRWLVVLISKIFVPQKRFFNNWLIWGQYFSILNITQLKKIDKKLEKKKLDKTLEKQNNLDNMKNKIFWDNNWKKINLYKNKSFNNDNFEDELFEFKKRFW